MKRYKLKNKSALAKQARRNRQTIDRWLSGIVKVGESAADNLEARFGVNANYILHGSMPQWIEAPNWLQEKWIADLEQEDDLGAEKHRLLQLTQQKKDLEDEEILQKFLQNPNNRKAMLLLAKDPPEHRRSLIEYINDAHDNTG